MVNDFLSTFMRFAQTTTSAERSMALDLNLDVQDSMNVEDGELESKAFSNILNSAVTDALEQNEAIITNNLITDPADAPNTNWHIHDLRMVVTIPLIGLGVIYLDQRVRHGVFERDTIDRLTALARQLIDTNRTDLSEADLEEAYSTLTL